MKNMLNIKEFIVKGKLLEFRLSYKAKIEIDKVNSKQFEVFADEDIVKVMPYVDKIFDESVSTEERTKMLAQIGPSISKLSNINQQLDPIELGYILLHNLKGNESLSKDDYYNDIIPAIEEEIGFEKMYEEFTEMYEEVFIRMERLDKTKANKSVPQDQKLTS
jgi:hypothetical protein